MIVTFARLQRLSGLERPSAIKKWLQKQAVSYLKDAEGKPFTTLEAINVRLQRKSKQEDRSLYEPNYGTAPENWAGAVRAPRSKRPKA